MPVSKRLVEKDSGILLKTSSFVTDGMNCNTGEKEGLWTKIKKLRNEMAGTATLCQLITIWFGVHQSNLAWELPISRAGGDIFVHLEYVRVLARYCSQVV